jgi:hypothetical protein
MIEGQGYGSTATPLSERLGSLLPPSMPTLPSFVALERRIQQVLDRYDAPANPPEREAERLFSEMGRRIIENDWHKVPMSFITRIASLVFSAAHVLRDDLTVLREFITAEVRASDRPGFLNPMTRIYMESYATGAKHTGDLASALSIARPHIGARWQPLLTSLPDLLHPDRAAKSIARMMDDMDDPWHGLRAKGLRQPHAPGLMDAAHLAFVDTVRPRLRDRQEIDRLLVWLRPDGQALRQVGAGAAITALLQAWADRDPPNELKGLLIDRLTEFYGHPRVNRHPAWNEVDPAHERTFLRWLMGADIRFLFRILTEVERGHMWADREAFWWTLYQQGRIDEVWIAFNEAGHRVAMSRLPADARRPGRRFGKQTGERDKSLLIMRIGNRVVVEGTYSFMVHAFDAQNSVAPALYKNTYDVADIRNRRGALWKVVHNGNWQDKVMRML